MSQHTQTGSLRNPWPGLAFYTGQDQLSFFGRDQETAELFRLVQRDTLTVLFGRSGMGKTSLLRAGLVPRLLQDAYFPILLRLNFTNDTLSLTEQVKALTLETARQDHIDMENLTACTPEMTLWEFFHTLEFWGARNDILTPVLIFDQFEELFTLGRDGAQAAGFKLQFADLVESRMPQQVIERINASGNRHAVTGKPASYKIIITLREDFVPRLDSLQPIMPAIMRNRLALQPFTTAQGLQVILGPGKPWIDEPVAKSIVSAVVGKAAESATDCHGKTAIEPAYLSVMCHELFRRMQEQGLAAISEELVASEQGNILDDLYERSFEDLPVVARHFVEDRLLTPSGFRATLPLEDARREGITQQDLNTLVDRRLLRFEDRLGARHVELSHDLLTGIARTSREHRQREEAKAQELRQQAQIRAKLWRSRLQTAGALLVALLVSTGALYYYLGYYREHVEYSRHFTKQWGQPIPLGKLSKDDVEHRGSSLKFTRRGWYGPVLSIQAVDSLDQLTSDHTVGTYFSSSDDRPSPNSACQWEFKYDQHNRVVYEVARDRLHRMVWGMVYSLSDEARPVPPATSLITRLRFAGIYTYFKEFWEYIASTLTCSMPLNSSEGMQPRTNATATFLGPDGYPRHLATSQAEFVEFEYDDQGFEHIIRYRDREGNPMPGPDYAYGRSLEYDAQGYCTRMTSLDALDQPMIDKIGNAIQELTYDEHGNHIASTAYDRDGEKILIHKYWKTIYTIDKYGRTIKVNHFDINEEPVINDEFSCHELNISYDKKGNKISYTTYNTNLEPCIAEGFFGAQVYNQTMSYDELNREISRSFYGIDQKAIAGNALWHRYESKYDYNDFESAVCFFDIDDQPVAPPGYGQCTVYENDNYGNQITTRFTDANKQPVSSEQNGYHLCRRTFNSRGNITSERFYNSIDEPCSDRQHGAHLVQYGYDRFDYLTSIRLFDATSSPTNGLAGWHHRQTSYTEYGKVAEERWYDKKEKPCPGPDGVHRKLNEYEQRGLLIRSTSWDENINPTQDVHGVFETICDWNDKQQQTLWQIFGLNKKPIEDDDGDHLVKHEFDARGREISKTCLRANGKANLDPSLGVATEKHIYNAEDIWSEHSYHDEHGHPTIGKYGYAIGVRNFRHDGTLTTNFGPNGEAMFNPLVDCVARWNGNPQNGVTNDVMFLGLNGEAIYGPQGYATQESTYDDEGRVVMRRWLGPNKKPVSGPEGFHRIEQRGVFRTTTSFYDISGHEISPQELEKYPSVIVINEILTAASPAAKAGMYLGDAIWQYGNWSLRDALDQEQKKGTPDDKVLSAASQSLIAEIQKRSQEHVPIIVLRNGTPVRLMIPPLPENRLGVQLGERRVPPNEFGAWRAVR